MNLVSGRYDTETMEFHRAKSENSQRDQDPSKLHRHSKQQNHRAWRSPGISRTNWPCPGAMQRPTSQMIPLFGSNHQSGVLPSSSRCWHPNGAASSDLSTWSPWHIGHHKIQWAVTGLENHSKCCTVACRTNLGVLSQPAIGHKRPCSSLVGCHFVLGPKEMLGKLLLEDQQKNLWSGRLHQGDAAVETAGASAGPPQAAVDAQLDDQCQGPQGEAPVNRDLKLQAHMAESTPLVSAIIACNDPDEPPAETMQSETSNRPGGMETHSPHSTVTRAGLVLRTQEGATDGAWPAVAPAISGWRRRRERKSRSCVSNRGTAQCAKSRWGAHSTWCQLPWGSGHVKARSTRVTRTHTRGHWWTRPGSKARVATAARTPMARPSRSRGNWSWETLPTNMKGRSGTLGEQSTLDKGLTDVGQKPCHSLH